LVARYVLTVEFTSTPGHAEIYKRMVDSNLNRLQEFAALKEKVSIKLQSTYECRLAQNSTKESYKLLCDSLVKVWDSAKSPGKTISSEKHSISLSKRLCRIDKIVDEMRSATTKGS